MEKGLPNVTANAHLKTYGPNEIRVEKPFSAIKLFFSQFPNLINVVLFLAGSFSLLIKDYIDAVFIFAVLLLNSIIGFVQEYRAEKSLEKLKHLITPLSLVIRDGKRIQIPTREIVPGDIVVVGEGERIPADGKITTNHHTEIDESILTGESFPVVKNVDDTIFSGTLVTKGRLHMQTLKTGMDTRFGQIAQTLSSIKPDKTPLQVKLDGLGKVVSLGAIFTALLIIPIGMSHGEQLIPLIFLSISAGIAAIPEGLPAVVTIALAIGTSRMARKKAIVRKMPVVETLGAVQVILIDKTGTLTKNVMRVKKHWLKHPKLLPLLLRACVLGNTATLVKKVDHGEDFDAIGEKTDAALLLFGQKNLGDIDTIKKEGKIVEEYVFDPHTKTITTAWQAGGKEYVFVRGAPEEIITKSKLTKSEKEKINKLITEYAKEGLRVIGFGTKIENHKAHTERKELERNLEFLGLVGIYDPPRDEAAKAVEEAEKAGIHTIMVTGDNELTALTIAKEVGLIHEDEDVLTGEEIAKMTDGQLKQVVMKTRIFARTDPEDKLRLVNLIKEMGFVVGVTGDGVNDALALKRADVGIAMGQEGTDVAKEASDIILTDDNFSTLVKAVEEGRTIYRNILTAITYLLTGNLSEISFIFLSALTGTPAPFHPTQILWINLITDGLPALALAADVKDPRVLHEAPRNPKAPLLTKGNILLILGIGISAGVSLLVTFMLLLQTSPEKYARVFVFNALLLIHLVMIFAIRGKSIFHMNRFLFFAILISVFAQIAANTLPFFRAAFEL